jgi:hypothetical protein
MTRSANRFVRALNSSGVMVKAQSAIRNPKSAMGQLRYRNSALAISAWQKALQAYIEMSLPPPFDNLALSASCE